jgi:hypothetical protein
VHTQREAIELQEQVLAPREDLADPLAPKARDPDLAVAADGLNSAGNEWLELLHGQANRRPLHLCCP